MQKTPFVFFDLGQTLVTEWDFIKHFDSKFLELLNGFGARLDMLNYRAIRDSMIRGRKIGHGSVQDLIMEVCKVALPAGYCESVTRRIDPEIKEGRKNLFRFADGAESTLKALSEKCELGIIANQSEDILELLRSSGLERYFKVKAISGTLKMKKPDKRIFEFALEEARRDPIECVMVGDRLDTDICPANRLGMKTIRVTDSLFSLQQPIEECEHPGFTVDKLPKVTAVLEKIISP